MTHGGCGQIGGRWAAAVGVAVALLYVLGWIALPAAHNEYLALPIARALADPAFYPSSDLIVSSGIRAPFHIYHAARWLYEFNLDVDLWWLGALVASLAALFAATFRLARSLGLSVTTCLIVPLLLATTAAHRMTIHETPMPIWSFMSASVGLPLAILAMALAIDAKWNRAAATAALAFLAHPGIGVLAQGVVAVLILFSPTRPPLRHALRSLAIGAALMLPNVLYIILGTKANIVAGDDGLVARTFVGVALHSFPERYAMAGYGMLALGAASAWLAADVLDPRGRVMIRIIVPLLAGIIAVYTMGVVLWPTPGIVQFYSVRATWLLKPLCLALMAAIAAPMISTDRDGRPWAWIAVGAWLIALLHQNPAASDGTALIGTGAAIRFFSTTRRGSWLGTAVAALGAVALVLAKLPAVSDSTAWIGTLSFTRNSAMLAVAGCLIAAGRKSLQGMRVSEQLPVRSVVIQLFAVVGAAIVITHEPLGGWVPATPSEIVQRARFSEPRGPLADMFRWVRDSTPRGSIFAVPPFDDAFLPMLHVGERSVYITADELAQLTYDVATFREGARRLAVMGVKPVAGTRHFDERAYAMLDISTARALAGEGVRYAIVPASTARRLRDTLPTVWREPRWAIIDLRPALD